MTSPKNPQPQRRASVNQPLHRRPFYSKDPRSFQTYMSETRRRASTRQTADFGLENFSYDPDHLPTFDMPQGLSEILPDELREEVQVWQMAAAAVETTLQRIDKLYQSAPDFAFPRKPRAEVTASNPLPILAGEQLATPPPPPFAWLDLSTTSPRPTPTPLSGSDAETPPLTPIATSSTDDVFSDITTLSDDDVLSDVKSTTGALAALDISEPATVSDDDGFDEMSWELYLRRYKVNFEDVHECHRRMKGFARRVNTLSSGYSHNRNESVKSAVLEFMQWWGPMERIQTDEFNRRVAVVDTPSLETIRME